MVNNLKIFKKTVDKHQLIEYNSIVINRTTFFEGGSHEFI